MRCCNQVYILCKKHTGLAAPFIPQGIPYKDVAGEFLIQCNVFKNHLHVNSNFDPLECNVHVHVAFFVTFVALSASCIFGACIFADEYNNL